MAEITLKDLPADMLPEASELPGDLAEVAAIIGVQLTLALAERFRGTGVYFHNIECLLRKHRDRRMRELYDTGQFTVKELARTFGVSERWAIDILNRPEPECKQLRLFQTG